MRTLPAYLAGLVLAVAIAALAVRALERDDYPNPYGHAPDDCPQGIAYTDWCGCYPPLEGDDC